MFIIKYYILIAIASTVAAFYAPNVYFSIVLAWIALSLSAVSFAYVSDSPWIFRKNDRGSIPLYIRWIFIPFLLGAQVYNSWQRRNDSVPPIQKINDKLFLACRLFPSDVEELKRLEVTAILDATAEFSGMNWSADDENLDYLNVPILDHQAPHTDDMVKAINWIHNHIRNDQAVVVHCALGRGRSVLIVAAYLIAAGHAKSTDDAIEQINRIRGTARLNKLQYKKLTKMHDKGVLALKKNALLIVNPVSGGGAWEQAEDSIRQILGQKYQLDIQFTEKDTSVKDSLTGRALNKYNAVLACGGDGTVNEVAEAILDEEVHFGIIPLGTTNALSHVLYGSKTKVTPVQTACEVILSEHISEIDAARCNHHIMLLAAGVGFEQKMIAGADRDDKDDLGQFAYLSALFDAVKENECREYQISFNRAKAIKTTVTSILIANASPVTTILAQGNGRPDPTDGKLDVTILNTTVSTSEAMGKLAAQAITRGQFDINEQPDFQHHLVDEIHLHSDSPIPYVIDGELHQGPELLIKVIPKAFLMFTHPDVVLKQQN